MHKWYWAWDFEKQEKWLNEMSAKGLQLIGVGFCKYVFEEGIPGEYNFHMELLKKDSSHPESIAYIHFMEDAGIEHIGAINRWVYFRKKTSDGIFDLFSDIDSRINHLKRICRLFIWMLAIEIGAFCVNILAAIKGGLWSGAICAALLGVISVLLSIGATKTILKIRHLKNERIMRE
jgi:hypothetical protein